jgi:hypothetical protein
VHSQVSSRQYKDDNEGAANADPEYLKTLEGWVEAMAIQEREKGRLQVYVKDPRNVGDISIVKGRVADSHRAREKGVLPELVKACGGPLSDGEERPSRPVGEMQYLLPSGDGPDGTGGSTTEACITIRHGKMFHFVVQYESEENGEVVCVTACARVGGWVGEGVQNDCTLLFFAMRMCCTFSRSLRYGLLTDRMLYDLCFWCSPQPV